MKAIVKFTLLSHDFLPEVAGCGAENGGKIRYNVRVGKRF